MSDQLDVGDSRADAARRSRLLTVKLRALMGDRGHDPEAFTFVDVATGTLAHDGAGRGWALIDGDATGRLGGVLARAHKAGVATLDVVADDGGDVLARRVAETSLDVTVHRSAGRDLVAVDAAPVVAPVDPEPAALDAAAPLTELGVDVVVEHGVVTGEIAGLEIARVVADDAGGGYRLESGVGRYDREASTMLDAVRDPGEALTSVVATVRLHRHGDARPHVLNRLARERWLRAAVLAEPGLVDAADLAPVEGSRARDNLIDPFPAAAMGVDGDGRGVVVVCSVGVDPELVPEGADVRHRAETLGWVGPDADLVLVVPPRDHYPLTDALAGALRRPARIVELDGPWPS
ncbi:MAG: hypothetical protein S0880_06180 [Actinomycetota bacterium]|nr:hypothetical protein [Actinomycetota bacterium]